MAEKVTRKELREPDEFISITQRLLGWVTANRLVLIVGAGVTLAVILGFFGWRWYVEAQTQKASQAFVEAQEVFAAPVVPRDDAEGTSQADGTFASEQDKLQAAMAAFEGVRQNYASSATASLATYFIGECHARLGEYDRAEAEFQAYLRAEGNHGELAAYAIEGIAAALEDKGDFEQAAAQYRRLTEEPFDALKDRGLYNLARIEEKLGHSEKAAAQYKQLLEEFPDTAFARDIQQRLAMLPGAAATPEEPGAGDSKPGAPGAKGQGDAPAPVGDPAAGKAG